MGVSTPNTLPTLPDGGATIVALEREQDRGQDALRRAGLCARTAEEHAARDIVVLDLRQITPMFDFFVIATGTSRRQMQTIADEIDHALEAVGDLRLGIEGYDSSQWILLDYGDVVIHVFDDAMRDRIRLESIWGDAPRVAWREAAVR